MSELRTMGRFWADVVQVFVYEVGEGIRTRSFLLVTCLYLMGLGAMNWIFIEMLAVAEKGVASAMKVAATERPGTLSAEVTQNEELMQLLSVVIGSDGGARALLSEPLLGLWAGAIAMALLPLLVTFNAAGSISQEVRSRSIRYLACRTGRLQIGLGKLFGQLAIGAVAAAAGVLLTLFMSQTMMVAVPVGEMVLSLVDRAGRACVYTLPWAGLALSIGALVPNPSGARVVTALALSGMHIGGGLLSLYVDDSAFGRVADLIRLMCANTAWADFWSTEPEVLASAMGRCVILAVAYYAVGHARFGTRDL